MRYVVHTVFPLFVPAGTILFFKFSRKKYQAKQCQKVRVQFKGVYNSRACTIRGNTVDEIEEFDALQALSAWNS